MEAKKMKFEFFTEDTQEVPAVLVPEVAAPASKVLNIFTLSFTPNVEIAISLNGSSPVARLRNQEKVFLLNDDELNALISAQDELIIRNDDITLVPLTFGDSVGCQVEVSCFGLKFLHYRVTDACPFDFEDVVLDRFELNRYATRKLFNFLPAIQKHVLCLIENRSAIDEMYESLAKNYINEYNLQYCAGPIERDFSKFITSITTFGSPTKTLRDFSNRLVTKNVPCTISHYNLYVIASVQFEYLLEIIKNNM